MHISQTTFVLYIGNRNILDMRYISNQCYIYLFNTPIYMSINK